MPIRSFKEFEIELLNGESFSYSGFFRIYETMTKLKIVFDDENPHQHIEIFPMQDIKSYRISYRKE